MSSPHLCLKGPCHPLRVELGAFLGDHNLKREVQQEIAELVAERDGIVVSNGLIDLEDFFDEVRAQRRRGLRAVPWAPLAQVADECECAPKR